MRKARRTLPIVLPALAILVILAVAGYAGKPTPPPQPSVVVTGGITGQGNPAEIRVTFVDSSLVAFYPGRTPCWFISNPDRPPSLGMVLIVPGPDKALKYRYCSHPDHVGTDETMCAETTHDPHYYYCLTIHGGVTAKKGTADLSHVTFPVGSLWDISSKETMSVVKDGKLGTAVTYDLTQ